MYGRTLFKKFLRHQATATILISYVSLDPLFLLSFFSAAFKAKIQRAGEDQDDREHVHGGSGTSAGQGGRESGELRDRGHSKRPATVRPLNKQP